MDHPVREVTGQARKPLCRSGPVRTKTGRRFELYKSENGKGSITRSPGSNMVPCLIFRVIPDPGQSNGLSIDQIALFATFLTAAQEQDKIEGFPGQRFGQKFSVFVNLIGDGHAVLRCRAADG